MRFFFVAVLALLAVLAFVREADSQSVGDQIRCLSCPGNDADHKDCCAKTRMCCEGRVKFVGNFPRPATTAYGR